jgi:hypothetical protein
MMAQSRGRVTGFLLSGCVASHRYGADCGLPDGEWCGLFGGGHPPAAVGLGAGVADPAIDQSLFGADGYPPPYDYQRQLLLQQELQTQALQQMLLIAAASPADGTATAEPIRNPLSHPAEIAIILVRLGELLAERGHLHEVAAPVREVPRSFTP